MASTTTRKVLGPCKKRLGDRVKEAAVIIQGEDITRMKDVRTKLTANIEHHDKLMENLGAIDGDDVTEQERIIIDDEISKGAELQMDAEEALAALTERLAAGREEKDYAMIKLKETEKIGREIEKLKIETEVARSRLEKGKHEGAVNKFIQKVKLPKLPLPVFGGKITEWPAFWDSYSSTVDKNEELSKVDKFKYLISSLSGEAREALNGFNLTEAQYEQAIKHLKGRYDDKEYILHSYYTTLSNVPKSSNGTSDIRRTFSFIETQLRSLECMGENIMNNYIVSLIKSKLPSAFNLKLEEQRDGEWTTDLLRRSINKLLLARERSEESIDEQPIYEYATEGLLSKDMKIKCVFCERSHWSDECQEYKTINERHGQIKGRCFVCLSKQHLFRECKSQKACFYFKRKGHHHSSLCHKKFQRNQYDNEDPELTGIGEEVSLNVNDKNPKL